MKRLKATDLVENPTPRVPICLCLDISGSMTGAPIQELNEGVSRLFASLQEDTMASYSAEVCIVTFGRCQEARCLYPFTSIADSSDVPTLEASGMTPMGEGVNLAIDLLEQRKGEYRSKGVDYYQPWLVLMTDGTSNGDPQELLRAVHRTQDLVNARKLTVFPIGIGRDADMRQLADFSPKRAPLRLQGLKFKEFFEWLSRSVSRTSQSSPGEIVPLDIEGIRGWGEL